MCPLNIKDFYLSLLSFGCLRRCLRKWRAKFLSATGHSDPYDDLATISRSIQAGLFIDVGCHHGDALLRFVEAGVNCPIVAFDPVAKNLEIASRRLVHVTKIKFERLALSDGDGSAKFFMNRNEQTSSLLENEAGNLTSFREDTAHVGVFEVPTRRLDAWYESQATPRPNRIIIKCDTQGAEGKVIRGGLHLIRNHVYAFYAEVMLGDMYQGQADFTSMRKLLEDECGLILHKVYPCLQDSTGKAVQMDALWIRP
jgi:FkbM family methyltransferase